MRLREDLGVAGRRQFGTPGFELAGPDACVRKSAGKEKERGQGNLRSCRPQDRNRRAAERALTGGDHALFWSLSFAVHAALLRDGNVELVARGGADGSHASGIEALKDALPTLKPNRIAGCGGLKTRHDSMTAGSGRRSMRSPSGCNGGTNCSSRPASVLRKLTKRPANSPARARISCWSATSSGPIRMALRPR